MTEKEKKSDSSNFLVRLAGRQLPAMKIKLISRLQEEYFNQYALIFLLFLIIAEPLKCP